MADIPFLGCKISLISKCDIRYEGILYCVDPKESTISLSKVKSYGTETRGDPANYVPPKNDVYDVIIFRASDVKDLRVDAPETPVLSDPAIISACQSSKTNFDGVNLGSQPTSSGPTQQQPHRSQQQQKPLLPFLPTGSNKEQSRQQAPPVNYSTAVTSNAPRRPDNRRQDDRRQENRRPDDRRQDERRLDDRRLDNRRNDGGRQNVTSNTRYNNDRRGPNYRDDESKAPMSRRRGGHMQGNRRGPSTRDDDNKGPMNRRRGGHMQGNRRGRSDDRTGGPRGPRKNQLKFEGEYDFDEANKLFLELEGKFKNLKVKEGENGEASGDRANSKSPTRRSESGSGYDSEDENNKDGDSKDGFGGSCSGEFYDKTKSFFDNISCEANERGQGKIGRPDWRKERQMNAETFGVSASYRRGGYRGRSYGTNGYHRR